MKKVIYYNTFDNNEMAINFYSAKSDNQKSPLIVFFFGGGWVAGSPEQFEPHANELNKCGYSVACVDYRVYNRHNTTMDFCLKDAFYSLKYLSDNANELCIDSENLFISGGSAGGHIALSCLLLNNIKHNFKIKGLPLFNPVTDTTKNGYQSVAILEQAFSPIVFSPYHHITADLPPVLIMHGKADTTVSVQNSIAFIDSYNKLGNNAKIEIYDGCNHGFFNFNDGDNPYYFDTLEKLKNFIAENLN